VGAKIIGVVLNRAEVHTHDYYYYHYNHKGYEIQPSDLEQTAESKSISIIAK
jgi:hypothetical protein